MDREFQRKTNQLVQEQIRIYEVRYVDGFVGAIPEITANPKLLSSLGINSPSSGFQGNPAAIHS